jgi:hypothetical protein
MLIKYSWGAIYQISTNIVWLQDNTSWQQLCINSQIPAKYRNKITNWAIKSTCQIVIICAAKLSRADWRLMFGIYIYCISCINCVSLFIFTNKWLLWRYHSNQPYNWFSDIFHSIYDNFDSFYWIKRKIFVVAFKFKHFCAKSNQSDVTIID